MKRKSLVVLAIVAVMCWVGTAGATAVSDILQVTWDGNIQTRTIIEKPGESVTEDLFFVFSSGFLKQSDFTNVDAFLVQPGSLTGQTSLNSNNITLVEGHQSDDIAFHLDNRNPTSNTQAVHFTLGSDEDPGRNNNRFGLEETGSLQDVTKVLFTKDQLQLIADAGHTVQVFAASDVAVPIPPTALLMGSGLLGLVGFGWRRKRS